MLTPKQRKLLLFIHQRMSVDDVPPSFEEMKQALGLKSKSGIHRLVSALVERGYIERLPHRARAIEIKKLPESFKANEKAGEYANGQESNQSAFSDGEGLKHIPESDLIPHAAFLEEVPIYGKIAAGTPIEAIRDEGQTLQVPSGLLGSGNHYALTVEGDSMVNAGILDGDTVIIRRCDTAENGEIVVALVDDHEATLKRLRRAGNKIVLEPENESYEPRILEPERVKIQGCLTSLLRNYH